MALREYGDFGSNPIDPTEFVSHLTRRFSFGLMALSTLFLRHPCLCNQQRPPLKLADGIGKVDVGMAFKQVVDGERRWEGRGDLVRRGKGGADITASIPDHLGMILQIQQ